MYVYINEIPRESASSSNTTTFTRVVLYVCICLCFLPSIVQADPSIPNLPPPLARSVVRSRVLRQPQVRLDRVVPHEHARDRIERGRKACPDEKVGAHPPSVIIGNHRILQGSGQVEQSMGNEDIDGGAQGKVEKRVPERGGKGRVAFH